MTKKHDKKQQISMENLEQVSGGFDTTKTIQFKFKDDNERAKFLKDLEFRNGQATYNGFTVDNPK